MSIATTQAPAKLPNYPGVVEAYLSREEWLNARRTGVGASDSAALFGVGYAEQTAITVYESKVCDPREEISEKTMQRLKYGKKMEPVLREILAEETGLEVVYPGEFAIFRHPHRRFLFASLDALCWNPETEHWCVGELKNIGQFQRSDWTGDQPPLKYAIQVQHQLAVTGCEVGYLLGFIGGNEPITIEINRNDRFIESTLLPMIAKFWKCVEDRILPDVDHSEATKRALARIYCDPGDAELFLPAKCNEWDAKLQAYKAERKQLDEEIGLIENRFRALLGDCTIGLLTEGGSYTWKVQERKGYWVNPSSTRVLRRAK